jgi:hypothetical protein
MEYGAASRSDEADSSPDQEPDPDSIAALQSSNAFYVILYILMGIVAFVLYNCPSSATAPLFAKDYPTEISQGIAATVRVTCPLALWFALHSLLFIHNKEITSSWQFRLHKALLWAHALVFLVLLVAFWFIPDEFYNVYLEFSIYASGIYLILQAIFLLDCFLALNESLLANDHGKLLIGGTIVLEVVSLVGFGVCYYIFGPDGCEDNFIYISINLVVCIALVIASIFIEHASIFTASLISAYCAYLTASALMCVGECSRIAGNRQGIGLSIIAAVFTLIWAGYSAWNASKQWTHCGFEDRMFSLSFFHGMFALAALYMTMIVAHWGQNDDTFTWAVARGIRAKWVNLAATWLIMLLYLWTLVAPFVLPDREFE